MPVDDKTANALADYFSSPAGAATLEEPTPAEGGQGEVGTPIAPKGPTISDDQAKALADSIDQQKPGLLPSTALGLAAGPVAPALQWLMENVPQLRTLTKAEATGYIDTAQGAAALTKAYTDFYRTTMETPSNDFVGKPLDEVRDQRNQLQAQRDQLETNFKGAMDTGKMGGLQATAASAEINEFQKKIDEANQVLQTGQVKARPTEETGPLKFLSDRLSQVQAAAEGVKPAIQQELPTSQEMDQSVLGQLAGGIGTMGSQLPFMLTGLGQLGFMAQTAGSVYSDAKAKGADDKTAEIAAVLDSFGSAAQYSTLELPAARLANLLKGQTPAKTILDLGRAVATGSVGMAGLQFYENAIARLTGYDPNRPLDEGVLQQASLGAGLSVLTEGAAKVPELIRYARPAQLEVRERPGAPGTETAQPPAPTPITPTAAAPTEPLAEAAAAVRATEAAPEQVLAAQGTPQEQLTKGTSDLDEALGRVGQPAAPATPPAAPATPEAPVAAAPTPGPQLFEPPTGRPGPGASAEELGRWSAWNSMSEAERDTLRNARAVSPQVLEFNARAAQLADIYRTRAANIRGEAVPPPLPEAGPSVTPDQVKSTTNDAATAMGMDQRVHYVASVDDLPGRVRRAMSQEQLDGTAQTVYDKGMGELWVIGDRFDGTSQHELNRTLIHDILPRVYGDLSDLRVENNPQDSRLGHYDILADRPVLNEAALLRTANPFEAASKTALEEIVAHQGITKLLGPREGEAYRNAMGSVRSRFDSLGLSDTLAQEKGFKNLDDMAKAYGFEDYAKNPRHNNALTEELWAAYAQRYGTLARLQEQAPQWWQQAVNTLSQGLRRRLGLGMSDLDVQNLVADSFGALRQPKWGMPSQFHPEIASQAKNDMRLYQLASLRGEGEAGGQTEFLSQFDKEQQRRIAEEIAAGREPPLPPSGRPPASAEALAEAARERQAAGVTDMARIGNLFVAGQRTETRAGLQPGEGLRAQPFKLSAQQNRPFDERMALADRATSVYDTRTLEGVLNEARQIFQRDFGGNVYAAMDDLYRTPVSDAHTAMRAVINEGTNAQIADLRSRGFEDAARNLEMTREKFNRDMASRVTDLAQGLNAQKLFYETGETAVGRLQAGLIRAQGRTVGQGRGVGESFRRIGQIGQDAARRAMGLLKNIDTVQNEVNRLTNNPQSLATRYITELATRINGQMGRLGFTDAERPMLQELFNRFSSRITDALKDPAAEIPTPEAAKRMSTTASIRETLSNFPMFERAWNETLTRLKTDNPNSVFFSKLDNALAEPFGEAGVRQVIRESGNDVRDLIFRHLTTQNRIGNQLAQSLVERAGLSQDQALRIQELFDNHYRNVLQTTSANELEQTLKRIGNPAQRAKGELERLTELMAIGGLDKQEYYNLLAPRFGLGAWNPEIVGRMKEAGAMLQRLRDEGGPEVYKNQMAARLADEIAKTQPWKSQAIRQAEGVWMASLLTGPFTHGSYYGQNLAQVMTNLALRTLFRPGVSLSDVARSYGDLFNGMIHSARTELPYILRTGTRTQRELPGGETAGMRAEGIEQRPALEATPLPKVMGLENPLNWYKYVGRFLHGMETVFYRGANNAITRSLAIRLADERGMSSEEGQRFAEQMVYGTENDRQEAIQQARQEQQRYGFDDRMRTIRENELLDQKRFARAPELADEAHRFSVHSIYRESPYGFLGRIASTLSKLRHDNPQMSLVTPFINLPANVANEFMNWTPIGLLRGRDAITGGTEAIKELYKEVPQFQRLVERGESGGISNRELRDLSYEFLAKGAVGTMGMTALGAMTVANSNNPDPPFAINGAGPAELAHRDALRAAGWQPYSIKIGDRYFDYQASPWKSMLGLVGGMADEMKYGKGGPQNWIGALATSAAKDGLATITDASFLQGLQTLLAAGGGTGGPGVDYKIKQFLSQEISSGLMIPFGGTGTKQLYRAFDPREFSGKEIPEMVLRNIPGLNSAFLQPKLNVLGEPVEINPLHRLLAAPTAETQDPVWKFLDQHNIGLSLPNTGRKVDGVQLSADELHEFTQVRGQYLKAELGEAINNPEFRALDTDQMDAYVKELERAADDVGKARIQDRRGGR
jgi:hypothetical protein